MQDLSTILRHVQNGGTVRFVMNYYGDQWAEFRTGFLWRKVRMRLTEQEVAQVKDELRRRGRVRQAHAA